MIISARQPPSRQTSVTVAVRVRPFTDEEQIMLVGPPQRSFFSGNGGLHDTSLRDKGKTKSRSKAAILELRKTVSIVDDRMLIFDPLSTGQTVSGSRNPVQMTGPKRRGRDHRFVFDHVFDEDATQEQVYILTTRPLLDRVLDGENATVLAYGATGCGKTHTISGNATEPGIVFRTMEELFKRIKAQKDTRVVEVQISFLEIYNEMIRDLLIGDSEPVKLTLLEDANQRISVSGLSTHTPETVHDAMLLLQQGTACRTSSPTAANATSSRSHAVLQIHVSSHCRTASLLEEHTYATLSIVDLAGSERAAATQNRGLRLHEGATINKSLLALGSCIQALSDPRKRGHVPWRNSKLTRLLKFSLGGNCRTVMVACVSPSSRHYDDTWNTLQYAQRAQAVSTSVSKNRRALDRHVASYVEALAAQKAEIDELRSREANMVKATAIEAEMAEEKCLNMIRNCISALQGSLNKHSHDRWRRCFSLAKRKLLLLQLTQLEMITNHVYNSTSTFGSDSRAVSNTVRRFTTQAEQLQQKSSEQILVLEKFYESISETDTMLADSIAHRLKKCNETKGWAPRHTDLLKHMAQSLREYSRNHLLVQSSVLFDFLVGEVSEYAYLCQVFCDCIDSAQEYRQGSDSADGASFEKILNRTTTVLEKMNDSDYDIALEAAAARFFHDASESNFDFSGLRSVSVSATCSPVAGLHKRVSRSPLRNTPPSKRYFRYLHSVDESDFSMDRSEEDSSLTHDVATVSTFSVLDSPSTRNLAPMSNFSILDSPPMYKSEKSHRRRISSSKSDASPYVETFSEYVPQRSLLDKNASSKILDMKMVSKDDVVNSMDTEQSMES